MSKTFLRHWVHYEVVGQGGSMLMVSVSGTAVKIA